MNILITGGTGFVGSSLVKHLVKQNHQVLILSRQQKEITGNPAFLQLPEKDDLIDSQVLSRAERVINLAGYSISSGRWTRKTKDLIRNTRIQITRLLVESIRRNYLKGLKFPKVLVSASAVGYYGTHQSATFDESSPKGQGFLASVCEDWEQEARLAEDLGLRVVITRLGVVLGKRGGALAKMTVPYRFGVGGLIGGGRQWCSWVHIEDLVNVIAMSLKDERFHGTYNLCSPQPVAMAELDQQIASFLGKRSWTRLPEWVAKLAIGEMAEELLINGQKVLPKRLLSMPYHFKFPGITEAVREALEYERT